MTRTGQFDYKYFVLIVKITAQIGWYPKYSFDDFIETQNKFVRFFELCTFL